MCGILGYIGNSEFSETIVNSTLNLMKSRGPNSQDFFKTKISHKHLFFLHSRLSIIDLDQRSNQPMRKDDCTIIFNGEIYNYLEIRNKLTKSGHHFLTNSDTEVILEAYKEFGENCVNLFEGMWSFSIYDKKKGIIFISRDRFGEKPLYYFHEKNFFCFGSEVKFILKFLNIYPNINYEKIKKFLVCGFRTLFKDRESFFSNIKELEPSCNLVLNTKNEIEINKYWKINYSSVKIPESEIYQETKRLLNRSMLLRMRADVPVAFCLSGGIDSSSLAAIATKNLKKNIHTFSVIDKDARYDESANISKVVNHLKCESSFIETSSENFLTNLEKIISYYQSPVPTVSYYIHNQLIKKIKESGFSVAISGTGADEIFTGYYDHYNFWLQMMTSEPNFEKLRDEWKKGYGRKVNNPLIKNITQFIENQNYREHLYQNSKDFNKILIDKIDVKFEEIKYSSDNLRNRMINELNHEIVPTILYSDDLNSMMHSIENRSPFLDKELVEFISSVDSSFLIKNGLAKFILRESMKNLLPKKIIFNKEKVGFNASILSFINLKNKNIVDWLLQKSPIFEVVNKKKFISLLNKDFSKNYFSKFLFNFISSKIFLERKFIF